MKIFRDKNFWYHVIVASSLGVLLGSDSPFLVFLPLGPFVVLWTVVPKEMNQWNRVGLCYCLGAAIQLVTVIPSPHTIAWQLFPLVASIAFFTRKTRKDPIFKMIVLAVVGAVVAGMYERIYMAVVGDGSELRGHTNLLGLLIVKAAYVPPFLVAYSVALYMAFIGKPEREIVRTK